MIRLRGLALLARRRLALLVLLAGGLPALASAQTLYTIEGSIPTIGQFTGQGACGWPNGPFLDVFPASQLLPPCPTFTGFAPHPGGMLGDVAVDHDDDRIWATDGLHVCRYTPAGVIDINFILPVGLALTGPATGLGYNSAGNVAWLTDGDQAAAVVPGLSCTSPTVLASFPLFGVTGTAQDIEYDACTGTLWVVTDAGHLGHYTLAGAEISDVDITPGPCGLGDDLSGLGLDTGTGTFYVTDGFLVAHVTSAGLAAPSTFFFPDTCETIFPAGPPAPVSGLAFSLRPARYGAGSDPLDGAPFPRMVLGYALDGDPAQSVSPGPLFALGVDDADPFGVAWLVISTAAPCVPFKFKGCDLYVTPPFLAPPLAAAVGAFGDADLALVIPAYACGAAALGVPIFAQWMIDQPGAGWEASEAVVFTFGTP